MDIARLRPRVSEQAIQAMMRRVLGLPAIVGILLAATLIAVVRSAMVLC